MIGLEEKKFIRDGFKAGIRSDGRACSDSRPVSLSLGDLQQCSGSARCALGSTNVIVGVKVRSDLSAVSTSTSFVYHQSSLCACMQAELGSPLPDNPECGGVQITVECSPCAGIALHVCVQNPRSL